MVQVSYGTLPFSTYVASYKFTLRSIDPPHRRNRINCKHVLVLSSSFLRNVPRHGQGLSSNEYSRTVGHCTLQDETTHPWNGSSYGASCLHVTVSTCPHPGMEQTQNNSFKQPLVGESHSPTLHRRYPAVQPARLKKDRSPPNAAPSGSFPRMHLSCLPPGVISVSFFATTEKLIEPRRYNLVGEPKLAQQKPALRRIGKRRALVVRDNNGGTTQRLL